MYVVKSRKTKVAVLGMGALIAIGAFGYRHWQREYGPIDMAPITEAMKNWQGARYTRADCLVQLDVDVDYGGGIRDGVMADAFMRYVSNYEPGAPIQFGGDGNRVFIQFFDQCPRRFEIAKGMAAYFERRNGAGVHLTVVEKRVDPGPATMDTCETVWLDCGSDRVRAFAR